MKRFFRRSPIDLVSPDREHCDAGLISGMTLLSGNGENYWRVCLWLDRAAYDLYVGRSDTNAATLADIWTLRTEDDIEPIEIVLEKLGEMHFVSGNWDVNTVSHEVTHAILHRMRYLEPRGHQVLTEYSEAGSDDDPEEDIAYEAGNWTQSILTWLKETDPQGSRNYIGV